MEDPWSIQSLFELQYFVCPSCAYKNNSKQEFVYHAFNIHPESIERLKIIIDDSLCDVNCPWNEIEIKEEMVFEQSEIVDNCQNGEILEIKEDCDPLDDTDNKIQNEKSTTESNDHQCQYCEEIFDDQITLKKHIRFLCPNLDDNNRKNLGIKPVTVRAEYGSFESRNMVPTQYGTYCQICGKSIKAYSMPNHMKIWHEGNSNKYKCEQCGNGFSNTVVLKQHIKRVNYLNLSFFSQILEKYFYLKLYFFAILRIMVENHMIAKNVIRNISVQRG